ncbi:unnamed protein product [Vitrella brassicaformis CCMP3155]|uniref:Uncharacterized protein n=3 Tax=Vitrella brassicaformis TaxID=1169539 RepID=A0A0G4FP27_VITBC|nr:unnamed protein product [Vitrella brassicaformis CCMP3155]|eukprot:CEM15572.1 unnamed protein product [Vitrella brassicaformis CCMP3155]
MNQAPRPLAVPCFIPVLTGMQMLSRPYGVATISLNDIEDLLLHSLAFSASVCRPIMNQLTHFLGVRRSTGEEITASRASSDAGSGAAKGSRREMDDTRVELRMLLRELYFTPLCQLNVSAWSDLLPDVYLNHSCRDNLHAFVSAVAVVANGWLSVEAVADLRRSYDLHEREAFHKYLVCGMKLTKSVVNHALRMCDRVLSTPLFNDWAAWHLHKSNDLLAYTQETPTETIGFVRLGEFLFLASNSLRYRDLIERNAVPQLRLATTKSSSPSIVYDWTEQPMRGVFKIYDVDNFEHIISPQEEHLQAAADEEYRIRKRAGGQPGPPLLGNLKMAAAIHRPASSSGMLLSSNFTAARSSGPLTPTDASRQSRATLRQRVRMAVEEPKEIEEVLDRMASSHIGPRELRRIGLTRAEFETLLRDREVTQMIKTGIDLFRRIAQKVIDLRRQAEDGSGGPTVGLSQALSQKGKQDADEEQTRPMTALMKRRHTLWKEHEEGQGRPATAPAADKGRRERRSHPSAWARQPVGVSRNPRQLNQKRHQVMMSQGSPQQCAAQQTLQNLQTARLQRKRRPPMSRHDLRFSITTAPLTRQFSHLPTAPLSRQPTVQRPLEEDHRPTDSTPQPQKTRKRVGLLPPHPVASAKPGPKVRRERYGVVDAQRQEGVPIAFEDALRIGRFEGPDAHEALTPDDVEFFNILDTLEDSSRRMLRVRILPRESEKRKQRPTSAASAPVRPSTPLLTTRVPKEGDKSIPRLYWKVGSKGRQSRPQTAAAEKRTDTV